ncbi:MAG: hypothetical protein IPK60_24060 [Sandaracinaceae bacterium]|nr:hypothetical protein [Sandaracinaceae bacterium]
MHEMPVSQRISRLEMLGIPPVLQTTLLIGVIALLIDPARFITGDTWFNLVFGREISSHGLPRTNDHTLFMHGAPWVDTQWLAHDAFYAIGRYAGFAALFATRLALWIGTFTTVASFAIRRGATHGRVAMLTLFAMAISGPLFAVRAQAFGELSYAALLVLLSRARTWKRDGLIALLLVFWCNVHGSVLLGIAVTGLAALIDCIVALRKRKAESPWRTIALSGASMPLFIASAFASPYGLAVWSAYKGTAGNPIVANYITEWARPTLEDVPLTFVGFALVVLCVWRARAALPAFHTSVLVVAALLALTAVRHAMFFGISFALVMPELVDRALPKDALRFESERIFRWASRVLSAVFIGLLVVLFATMKAQVSERFPAGVAREIEARAGVEGRVFASPGRADWLLFYAPQLKGRVAYDARAELFEESEMLWVADLMSDQPSPQALFRLTHYEVLCLSSRETPGLIRALEHTPVYRQIQRDAYMHVYLRAE